MLNKVLEEYLKLFKDEIRITHYNIKGEKFKEIIFKREYVPSYENDKTDEFIEFLEDYCWNVEEISGGFVFTWENDYIVVITDIEEWYEGI